MLSEKIREILNSYVHVEDKVNAILQAVKDEVVPEEKDYQSYIHTTKGPLYTETHTKGFNQCRQIVLERVK